RIKSAARRLQEMINDALEFVSAETSLTRIELKSTKTKSLFNESALPETIQSAATERHVEFKFEIENQKVVCDEKIIRNVFRRLAHNAAKFADPNSTVTISGRSKENGLYELSIANSGNPIDQRRIDQLMKPFTLNENMLNHSVGTGLGLSI